MKFRETIFGYIIAGIGKQQLKVLYPDPHTMFSRISFKKMILAKYFSRGMSIGMRNPVVLIVVQLLNQEKKNFAIIVGRTFQNENMTKTMSITAHFQLL